MLFVVITGLTLLFVITVSWYFSQALIVGIASAISGSLGADAASVLSLTEFASIVWGPILDVLVVLWMIASAQVEDVQSGGRYY